MSVGMRRSRGQDRAKSEGKRKRSVSRLRNYSTNWPSAELKSYLSLSLFLSLAVYRISPFEDRFRSPSLEDRINIHHFSISKARFTVSILPRVFIYITIIETSRLNFYSHIFPVRVYPLLYLHARSKVPLRRGLSPYHVRLRSNFVIIPGESNLIIECNVLNCADRGE